MAVGWTGRMEFGPRALGGRSIIADPRSPKMQILTKVKYRESFDHLLQASFLKRCMNGLVGYRKSLYV